MARYILRPPGVVSVSDNYSSSANPETPFIVGDPNGLWNDDSDATYAELETFEHPDVSYADSASATLPINPAIPSNPASVRSVLARVRYQALDVDMRPPMVWVDQFPSTLGTQRVAMKQPTGPAAMTPTWIEIPLDLLLPQDFLDDARSGTRSLVLSVLSPYLSTYSFRAPWMRIFEAMLIVETASNEAPPCRQIRRGDHFDPGGARMFPPSKMQQTSPRHVGAY